MKRAQIVGSTLPVMQRPLAEALAILRDAGFRKVELMARPPQFSLDPKLCDPDQVLATARNAGVEIANLSSYAGTGLFEDDPARFAPALAEIRLAVDIGASYGCHCVRVLRHNSPLDHPGQIPKLVPWLQRAAAYAAARGVYLGIENHRGGALSRSPEACRELAGKVGSPFFGVIYDPGNLFTLGTDYRSAFEIQKRHIVHVHLKDGLAGRPESMKTTMLGEGEIDIPWILRQLDSIGYTGPVTLEYEMETPPPEVGLKRWFEIFSRWMDDR